MDQEPKQIAEFDQAEEALVQNFPRFWHRMYNQMLEEGFSPDQAMKLLIAYIQTTLKGG